MDRKELAEKLRLYLICGEGDTPDALIKKTELALEGGVTAVQLRVKTWTARETYTTACKLKDLCHAHCALFFVNDRLDIALASGADGVHLGQKDLPIDKARLIAGKDFIIGGTARTPELARDAEQKGADYIGCGAAFATGTKNDAVVIGPAGIKKVLEAIDIPAVAIGGIGPENVAELADSGADGIALSASIVKSDDPKSAAEKLIKEIHKIIP